MAKYLSVLALVLSALVPAAAKDSNELRLATTTSLENSGLLGYLLPDFERQCACQVRVIPVGTGKALALGRRGDVDVLLVHAPAAEEEFIAAGHGIDRRQVAYNYFVLLMPPTDAADASSSGDVLSALQNIAGRQVMFLSRGDESGTHQKELNLWQQLHQQKKVTVDYDSSWYIEAGTGMGQAIMMADELGAYVLADSGTYLHLRDKVQLRPAPLPPSQLLYNTYSVIRINEQRHPHVNTALASRFVEWLQQPATRRRIAGYRLLGESLFVPAGE